MIPSSFLALLCLESTKSNWPNFANSTLINYKCNKIDRNSIVPKILGGRGANMKDQLHNFLKMHSFQLFSQNFVIRRELVGQECITSLLGTLWNNSF